MSTKQTYPIALKLFPRTKLLVQHGVIKEPKWFPAMQQNPPIVMRKVKKVPKLVYPEDALVRMAKNRSKWLDIARNNASENFDVPPTALFVTRQMELMSKHGMELHDAFDITENEFMKKFNDDVEERREQAATRTVMREKEMGFTDAEKRVAEADEALVNQVKENLGDLAVAMKEAEAESGDRKRHGYSKVQEVLDRIVTGTRESVTSLDSSAHRQGYDFVGASTLKSRGRGVYEVTGEGAGGKKKSIVMRRAVTRGGARPGAAAGAGKQRAVAPAGGAVGVRSGRQVGSSATTAATTTTDAPTGDAGAKGDDK